MTTMLDMMKPLMTKSINGYLVCHVGYVNNTG
jgi:hypothetical protein